MPLLNGQTLRKYLPSDYAIVYVLKSETYKAIALLLLCSFLICLPYWILCAFYLSNVDWYDDNYLPYVWIYVRCFWNCCFLVVFYHSIFHIRASATFCIALIIFVSFNAIDSYLVFGHMDKTVVEVSHDTHTYNKHICDIFNCLFIDTFHFMLFVISFPLMLIFGLFLSVIWFKCSHISSKKVKQKDSLLPNIPETVTPNNNQRNNLLWSAKSDNVSINSIHMDEQSVLSVLTNLTLNADALTSTRSSKSILSNKTIKKIQERRIVNLNRESLKNPTDSSHLSILYGSDLFNIGRKNSATDSILQMIEMEKCDLPILKNNVFYVFLCCFLLSILMMALLFFAYLWYFVSIRYVDTGICGLAHYALLLLFYAIFNAMMNKISGRIDVCRQYIYDIPIQLLTQCFVDSFYFILYRYCLLLIMPLMGDEDLWWIVISAHNFFHIILPTFLTSEFFYNFARGESIGAYNDWRERCSLNLTVTVICGVFSFLSCCGFIVIKYLFGKHEDGDIDGMICVLSSVAIEYICVMIANRFVFEGAFIEPMLRLYELNPMRLLLSVAVILAMTLNVFGSTLFQQTLAGTERMH